MKKIILLLLLVITSSCGYAPIDNSKYVIITGVEQYNETYSDYKGVGNLGIPLTLTEANFLFRDRTGKFNIGDTITFVKYKK